MTPRPSIMGRYLLRKFLGSFAFTFALLLVVVFLADTFDRLNLLVKQSGAGFGVLLLYLWLNVPLWAARAVPVAALISALFVSSEFMRSGEWLAAQAAGFKPLEMARQFWWGALAVTVAMLAAQETVLPAAREAASRLYAERLRGDSDGGIEKDILLIADAQIFLMAREFDPKAATMARPVMDQYRDGRLWRQVDARSARWDPRSVHWVFEEGVLREFGERSQPVRESSFLRTTSGLRVPPRELRPRKWEPDWMGVRELMKHVDRLRRLDLNESAALRALHFKLAYPFANLVLAALAVPFAFRLRRRGRWTVAAAAIAICFGYWVTLSLAEGMAKAGALPDPVAAWTANALAAAAAVWLYTREGFS